MGHLRKKHPASLRSQGFTLVEAALVLVVFLMIASTAAWNLSGRINLDQERDTAEYLHSVHEAIIDYAIENRTLGAFVVYRGGGPRHGSIHAPSGRPYLPCPDVDGDGLEDRLEVGTTHFSATITVSVNDAGSAPFVAITKSERSCVDSKGVLPWRTLNVQPADIWGQHYTYWVDGNFSNGVFGFDQTTKANAIFNNAAFLPGRSSVFNYMLLQENNILARDRQSYASGTVFKDTLNDLPTRPPTLYFLHAGDTFDASSPLRNAFLEQRNRDMANGDEITVSEYGTLGYGQLSEITELRADPINLLVNPSANSAGPDFREFVSNGIAFAVISHGRNGYGGRVYEHGRDPSTPFACKEFPNYNDTDHIEEKINARLNYPCEEESLSPGSCTAGIRAACFTPERKTGTFFVIQNNPQARDFDDIVTWMNPGILISRLSTEGVLPLRQPPVAGMTRMSF